MERSGVRRALLGLFLVAPCLATCGDAEAKRARAAAAPEARAALTAGDASGALQRARAALAKHGEDAALHLVAAEACLRLERFSEAVRCAEQGQALRPEGTLLGDLQWVEGMGRLGLWKDLHEDGEWRRANARLQLATLDSNHRADAAYALVLLHFDARLGNSELLRRFVRLVEELAPESENAAQARLVLQARGLDP